MYTDGSCLGNPGPGGWAAVSTNPPFEIYGKEPHTTNNRMELTAVIKGLEQITTGTVDIHTDSAYVKNGITKWVHGWLKNDWKTSNGSDVKNKDLWLRLVVLTQQVQVHWYWVKAHAGNVLNERADQLAREQAEALRQPAREQAEEPVPRSTR
jgi:ribonuclease HI